MSEDKKAEAPKREAVMGGKSIPLDITGQPMHWLVRPKTIKLLWVLGIALLALTTWLGTTVHPHAQFSIEGTLGFYSWYGFITCVAMVLFAKLLGLILSRKDTFYD